MGELHVLDHPLIQHKLSILRDKNTGVKEFREIIGEIAALMCYEATRDLPLENVTIETPVAVGTFKRLAGKKVVCFEELQAALEMVVRSSLNNAVSSYTPDRLDNNPELSQTVFRLLRLAIVDIYPFVRITRILQLTAENHAPRTRTLPIKYIVMHYLGVPNADNPYLYNGGYGGHYNVTRAGKIYKAVDPRKGVVWHCGGGLQGNSGHTFYGKCTNYNSIGIECGVCADTDAKDLSGDSYLWYFTEETQESCSIPSHKNGWLQEYNGFPAKVVLILL